MKKEPLTSKSIRIEKSYVDYIDHQPGKNFTEKLSRILEEYINGEAQRKENIAYYEKMIQRRRKELQQYTDLGMVFERLRNNAIKGEVQFSKIMDDLKEIKGVLENEEGM